MTIGEIMYYGGFGVAALGLLLFLLISMGYRKAQERVIEEIDREYQ